VRCQRLLQFGGRAGRAEKGPRGRNGSGWRGERRQRALAVEAGWQTMEGGGRGQRGTTDRWGRAAMRPGVSGGVRGVER
jgi:hypothetical protein